MMKYRTLRATTSAYPREPPIKVVTDRFKPCFGKLSISLNRFDSFFIFDYKLPFQSGIIFFSEKKNRISLLIDYRGVKCLP